MSHWSVQLVIGKLVTEEDFRRDFADRGAECLHALRQRGIDLSDSEIAALIRVGPRLWLTIAKRIDPLLRRGRESAVREGRGVQRPFTVRQQRVLRGIFEGLANKEIGAEIGVSEGAVKATVQQLFAKTHVRTRAQLVRIAIEGSASATDRSR